MASKIVETAPLWDAASFATSFMHKAGRDNVLGMACGGGAFVIAELCERLRTSRQGVDEAKGWFGRKEVENIRNSGVKGKDVLLEKIKLL